ncbi:carboxypeptidase family protein [Asanoa ferruginea]|uniref:Carboxypeptidase family protein n=1 Tax=Asanoa ferruginea TaxID=53367 RepID=A0A3D9ZHZ5_9ACTN|nr:carboxypeptidase-like regulatory domain-containing protein [Asanoa ferruginea]REF96082.1 carboxypeptidase family protein [Asanoa ferruginea]
MSIVSFSNGTLSPGQKATVRFRVTNQNPGGEQTATIKVSTSFGELSCTDGCDSDEQVGQGNPQTFEAEVTAGNVADGQTKSGQVIVQVTINGESGQATRDVTVRGKQVQAPPPVETVKSISGKVTNQADGKGVSGAYVALSDGASKLHETLANASGNFTFTGTTQNPIAPGQITIGASKDDKRNTKTVNLNAGQSSNNVVIQLPLAAAPPSVSATPLVPTEAPDDEITDEATATDSAIAAAPAGNTDDGGGFGNWLVVLGGGLLVAFGVGGIIWVMLRRKESDDPDDETSTTGVRPAVPAGGAAGYRGGGNDATRIAGAGAGGMADAPTMLHNRAPMDEFPDPYGAPMPPQAPTYGGGAQTQPAWGGAGGYGEPTRAGGYDQQTQMYNPAPGSGGGYGAGGGYPDAPGSGGGGYGGAPASGGGYGGAPASGGGYGGAPASGGDYGGQQAGGGYGERFDEPTGRYEPASGGGGYGGQPNGGYPQQGGGYGAGQGYSADERGYGAEPNGYDQGGNGYGAAGGQRGGYDQGGRGGYEGGGYGGAPSAGYDQGPPAGGYPAGGYDPTQVGGYPPQAGGGYGGVPEQRGGGDYAAPDGYGERGDYYPEENEGRGARHGAEGGRDRRQLGWLDD